MGWSWVQLLVLYMNGIAASDNSRISLWPSSLHAEIAAIYSALSHIPFGASVTLYVNSSIVIARLESCIFTSAFTDSRLYYCHPNFEL